MKAFVVKTETLIDCLQEVPARLQAGTVHVPLQRQDGDDEVERPFVLAEDVNGVVLQTEAGGELSSRIRETGGFTLPP